MRLFIGLILPTDIREELFKIQKEIKSNFAKINWVAKKNLHLTLKFLGNVDEKNIPRLISKLNKVTFKPFRVNLFQLGVFPNLNAPKVLWVGINPVKKVIYLQQKIDAELLSIFKFDQKFNSHVTLGRIKLLKNKNKFFNNFGQIEVVSKNFEINSFYLLESVLNHNCPKYKIIHKFDT